MGVCGYWVILFYSIGGSSRGIRGEFFIWLFWFFRCGMGFFFIMRLLGGCGRDVGGGLV